MSKRSYDLFLQKSGLSPDEAFNFLDIKLKECQPENKDEVVDLEFIDRLAVKAKEWKNNGIKND